MNKVFHIIFVSTFFLLYSCMSSTAQMEKELPRFSTNTATVLFSDPTSFQTESTYYDALLELQTTYDIHSVFIVDANEHELIQHYDIKQFPTILVLFENKDKLRLEG